MSEENQVVEKEVVVQTDGEDVEGEKEVTPESTAPSAVEQKALDMGWRPKSEFEGDEEDFIDATEFVRRKPLFEKIDNVGKELRETKKALKALQAHHEKVKEAEFQHALKSLRAEKKEALEAGDADRLIEIDDQIADAKAAEVLARNQSVREAAAPHPNFVQWASRNPWYKTNAELTVVADQIGTAYAASNPDTSPDDVLLYVEKRVRKLYPENFTNPNKSRPSAVEGGTSTPSKKPADDSSNYPLTEDERRVMMTFVRQGVMTKEQYIEDLKKVKG
jgi:hypothetical protein